MPSSTMFRAALSSMLLAVFAATSTAHAQGVPSVFVRGDLTGDQHVSIADFISLTDTLFVTDSITTCEDAADVNDDGLLDIGDAAALLRQLFGPVYGLPSPFPFPGMDPTADGLALCDMEFMLPDPGLGADIDHIYLSPYFSTSTGGAVFPGQTEAAVTIALDSLQPLRGFTIVIEFPSHQVANPRLELEDSVTEAIGSELVQVEYYRSEIRFFVAFDSQPPFDEVFLPGGDGWNLGTVVFDVSSEVELGDRVKLQVGTSRYNVVDAGTPLTQVVTIDGSEAAVLVEGIALDVRPRDESFVRGDTDRSGDLDLGDAIVLLMSFYLGATPTVPCPDSYDVDDNGNLDIADPIFALQYLFAGGVHPPAPYPRFGFDTTSDSLPCP